MPQPRNLVILAMLEGLVLMICVYRFSALGFAFANNAQLAWFVGTVTLAASSVALFVLRTAKLRPRLQAGERLDDEQRQILGFSIALVVLAGLSAAAGPSLLERLLTSPT